MTKQPPRLRPALKQARAIAFGAIIGSGMLYACAAGVDRQQAACEELRAQRCGREEAPAGYTQKQWDSYCTGVGQ